MAKKSINPFKRILPYVFAFIIGTIWVVSSIFERTAENFYSLPMEIILFLVAITAGFLIGWLFSLHEDFNG